MDGQYNEDAYEEEYEDQGYEAKPKLGNTLTCWGNPRTMNLNHLVLTNVQNSPYFKVRLFELKTYHEVVDEIYYKVDHLEPWERGTRKTAGQTGMCGGVRGVGAGGVVSTSFCILFKLFTLKLTRKQVNGLLNHTDSPFIRGLGVMYIRYTQAPKDLWNWYEPYLEDEEEIDVKAGGGCVMTIGMMIRTVLTKLDWFSTLFPRIPVPIQKEIDEGLSEYGMTGLRRGRDEPLEDHNQYNNPDRGSRAGSLKNSPAEHRSSRDRGSKHRSPDVRRPRSRSREHRRQRSRSRDNNRRRDERSRRSGSRDRKRSSRDKDSRRRSPVRSSRHRSRSRDRHHRRSPESHRSYRSR